MRSPIRLICLAVPAFMLALSTWGLPEPATGGKGGGPLDLLLIKGHSEWNFGTQPELDATYQQMLKDRGYRITTAHEWQELTPEFLKQFHTVVYLNPSAYMGGGYFDHIGWRSGPHLLTVRKNLDTLREWLDAGGGLLLVPTIEEIGLAMTESINHMLAPYGLETFCAVVTDRERAYKAARVGSCDVEYPWTESLGKHPVSANVKRIYYPSYCTRWDDNYTTIPLRPLDKAWTVVAKGMPGSTSEMRRSPIYDDRGDWTAEPGWEEPAIIVAREYGKGRLVVSGISAWHLFYITYAEKGDVTESAFSRVDGIPMTEGDGETKSDLHILLDNAYRWLAESSLAAGMGGFDAAAGIILPPESHEDDDRYLSDVWADKDPMVTGEIRPIKILVGARSAASDGAGSPADWAKAAKAAGYDVVCFTETFEKLNRDNWKEYVAACRQASDDEVELVPGVNVESDLGDRFLVVGLQTMIRRHLLTPDGQKLFWTGHLMLGMGNVLPCVSRPQWAAGVRGAQGALPPDIYSHVSGIPVATYEVDRQVDDGLFAYRWHLFNSTQPFPIAVHEVSAPAQLGAAAKAGLQSYVNSDTPAHAAFYFRQGFANFGGNPGRYYVSSGPFFDACAMDDWQSPHWCVTLKAHADAGVSEILVHNQEGIYRRFTPKSKEAEVRWHGDLGRQQYLLVEARDAAGGKAYLTTVRTLPMYNYSRCMDRQNFFGTRFEWLSYTGYMRQRVAFPELPGVQLATDLCPKPQMVWGGYLHTILDFVLDSTYVPAGQYFDAVKREYVTGGRRFRYDNAPIFHDMPIPEYWAKARYVHYRSRRDTRGVSPAAHVDMHVDIELRKDLQPQGDVWPMIGRTSANAEVGYTGADGKRVTGKVEKFVDLPVGGFAGDIVALTPLRVGAGGEIGFPAASGVVKAGTKYHGEFTKFDAGNRNAVLKSMGVNGPTPYRLAMKQGTVKQIVAGIRFETKEGGVAGHLTGAAVPSWAPQGWRAVNRDYVVGLPLRLYGANPRWVAGLWTSTENKIEPFSFLGDVCLGNMLADKDADFYFGNLVTATDANLNLAFATEWTADSVKIEVNNPTDQEIAATVETAQAIQGRKQVKEKVSVPAGGTVYVEAK